MTSVGIYGAIEGDRKEAETMDYVTSFQNCTPVVTAYTGRNDGRMSPESARDIGISI